MSISKRMVFVTNMPLSELRHVNQRFSLSTESCARCPFVQLQNWLDQAIADQYYQPNAMSLSTVNSDGQPTSRIVLLKQIDETGLIFYTNYQSHKGKDLAANPLAAALFYWDQLERQVRVEGKIDMLDPQQSDRYFASRPRETQLGAIASPQSETISNRQWLDQRYQEVKLRYDQSADPIARPKHWGGYRLIAHKFEFWQGRPSRLHDRICYVKQANDNWYISRLAP